MKKTLLVLVLLCSSILLSAQSLQDLFNESLYILEGKVIGKNTYKVDDLIYTANQIEVINEVYVRNIARAITDTVYVITEGGVFEDEGQYLTHTQSLDYSEQGFFFLKEDLSVVPVQQNGNSLFLRCVKGDRGLFTSYRGENDEFILDNGNLVFDSPQVFTSQLSTIVGYPVQSVIYNNSNGIVVTMTDGNMNPQLVSINLNVKSLYNKSLDLNQLEVKFDLGVPMDMGTKGIQIQSLNSSINNGYQYNWSQPTLSELVVTVMKNNTNLNYFSVSSQSSEILSISADPSILNVDFSDAQIIGCKYTKNTLTKNFQEKELINNTSIIGGNDELKVSSIEPSTVAAGIKEDYAIGSGISGVVTIHGDNLISGEQTLNDIIDSIPFHYRVMFLRIQDKDVTKNYKTTPLPEDYILWTKNMIKVRVPTYGYKVNLNGNFVNENKPTKAVATSGKVTVVTPKGKDAIAPLEVAFGLYNYYDGIHPNDESMYGKPMKMGNVNAIKTNASNNGSYYFVYGSTFNQISKKYASTSKLKEEIEKAFCEWNQQSSIYLEIVETCPENTVCSKITAGEIQSEDSNTVSLASVTFAGYNCDDSEDTYNINFDLKFNKDKHWWLTEYESFQPTDAALIYTSTLHELGHIMGMTHVENSDRLMYPLYDTRSIINIDQYCKDGVHHERMISENLSCESLSIIPQVDNDCMTPISDEYLDKITILPNPSVNGIFQIQHTKIHPHDVITIYNTRGEQVQHSVNGNTIKLNNAPSGIYFISIHRNESIYYAGKIIVI